ncbi:NAD(P)-binding protein [Periconia macrospinosa]|uniref:NAD(P)-binding protein n=1 Tax=Periconia macrospinosa TaxID=97972 RepID=A0A2V1DF63_9PLEO|nr:NAD(P)-binding protein [Periconia macrospinosa]
MVPKHKLLITGITGYIGFQTLIIALQRGYSVRGVIRNHESIATLRSKSSLIARCLDNGNLDLVIVPDFLQKGGLLKHMGGITTIVHLASPLASQSEDYEHEIIVPAVKMVQVVLEAAAQTPSVSRVIITSSCVTLVPFQWNFSPDSERLYTAQDINSSPIKPYGSPMEAYWASKALARVTTRDFMKDTKLHFDFVNLLPSVVIGPDARIPADGKREELTVEARGAVMAPALSSSLNSPFPFVGVPVHVGDVARAHIDAVELDPAHANSEYILSSDTPEGVIWDRDTAVIAKKYFAKDVENKVLPLEGSLAVVKFRLDSSTTEKAFGWKHTSFEQTMKEMIMQYLQLNASST